MSSITFDMVCRALECTPDLAVPEDRAAFWRMWVTLERELEAERMRQAREQARADLKVERTLPRSPTDAASPNLGAVLGALTSVMAASQAPRPKDEDDGA